ncbi:helix-turn-helix domain-containing protein [Paenibacillus sp. IB182496]|uniref:Helix-turn-helix domain-containing protein n=1 Tax=Paenibacillus sabuli TaxID=2772509 RepID=A0A927BX32_9BACL|nr:helix-turn-helix domain-containing protein [Paenibacillus sabuli]MBD2847476.1 helix-turn-helix domain-containing protein [Paenibacillus sabuli]
MLSMPWKEQLEQVLNCPLRTARISVVAWHEAAREEQAAQVRPTGRIELADGRTWYAIAADSRSVDVLEVPAERLTMKEQRLLEWTIQQLSVEREAVPEAEPHLEELGQWVQEQLDAGIHQPDMPERLTAGGRLFSDMIPFLLMSEQATSLSLYGELEKLLSSFFEEEVMLIPLKEQEWLILGPTALLSDADQEERTDGPEETQEELLASMCSGLHGMLASEWVGECHLAVAEPMTPAKSIVETVGLLRETIYLGRRFYVGDNIHLPWRLHLERLLGSVPEAQRARFMNQILSQSDVLLEQEFLTTLETFFSLDCNVSETAKKLYIHRNTLLYRLDKLKQETGLDVRVFSDAVLVKILLLLYKVTKRM